MLRCGSLATSSLVKKSGAAAARQQRRTGSREIILRLPARVARQILYRPGRTYPAQQPRAGRRTGRAGRLAECISLRHDDDDDAITSHHPAGQTDAHSLVLRHSVHLL